MYVFSEGGTCTYTSTLNSIVKSAECSIGGGEKRQGFHTEPQGHH